MAKILQFGSIVTLLLFSVTTASGASKINYEKDSLSSTYLHGPENGRAKVYLYAPDQTITVNQYLGGGSFEGDKIVRGHYRLVLDPETAIDGIGGEWSSFSELDLGELQFNLQRKPLDGKLDSIYINPDGYQNALAIYQYGSSNTNVVYIYNYIAGKFKPVHFLFQSGKIEKFTEIGLGEGGFQAHPAGHYISNSDAYYTSKWYDNTRGYVTTKWVYHHDDNNFHEVETKVTANP